MEAVWDRVWVRVLGSHFWGFGGYLGFHLGVFGIPFLGLFGAIWGPIFGSDGGTSGQGFGTPFLGLFGVVLGSQFWALSPGPPHGGGPRPEALHCEALSRIGAALLL